MSYFENLTCGCEECHYNHDSLCYRESLTMDKNGACEDMVNCDDFDCQDCEYFDYCTKEKKYNSTAFTSNENYFSEDEF